MHRHTRRTGLILVFAFTSWLAVATMARADVKTATDNRVVVAAGQTHDGNLYAFGEEIVIDGTVTGDLIGAGRTIRIGPQGHVEGDVLAAGQSVLVQGQVDGDVRGAGYLVQLDAGHGAKVGGDLAGAGYSLSVGDGATVGGDVLAVGYQLLVDGTVDNNVNFGGAALDITGAIHGNVTATVAGKDASTRPRMMFGNQPAPPRTAPPGLTVGEGATIDGTLAYSSPTESTVPKGAAPGGVQYTYVAESANEAAKAPAPWWAEAARGFVALLLIALLVLWLVPRRLALASRTLGARPLASGGYGVLALFLDFAATVGLFIVSILALVVAAKLTLGGQLVLPIIAASTVLGVLLTFGFYLLTLFAKVVVAFWLGSVLLRSGEGASAGRRLGSLMLGVVLVALAISLPYGLGTLATWLIVLFGLGATAIVATRRWLAPSGPTAIEPVPVAETVALPVAE